MNAPPGYFGKVVTHGDFVQRRMAPGFVAGWDRWLQDGMADSARLLGDGWCDAYLNCPVWRFTLAPALCGAQGMAGVLVPGVDRIGRHFPLTLAAPVVAAPGDGWYDMLERLALDSVAPGFSLDALDAALARLGPPAPAASAPLEEGSVFWTLATRQGAALCKPFPGMPPASAFCALLAGLS